MLARFTYGEYLELDERSALRLELHDGIVSALPGQSAERAGVTSNVIAVLGTACRQGCRVFDGQLRIRVPGIELATYPSASVVCGQLDLDPDDHEGNTVVNPTVLVEVPSETTDRDVRMRKLVYYQELASLREIVVVAHEERRIDLWRRTQDDWAQLVFHEGQSVELESLGCALPVDEIYFDPLAG